MIAVRRPYLPGYKKSDSGQSIHLLFYCSICFPESSLRAKKECVSDLDILSLYIPWAVVRLYTTVGLEARRSVAFAYMMVSRYQGDNQQVKLSSDR